MTGARYVAGRTVTTTLRPAPWQATALEVVSSLVAAVMLLAIPFHYADVHVTWMSSEPVIIYAEDVHRYWWWVTLLAVGVVGSFIGAWWRHGNKAFAWHILVAVVGVVLALAFSVTEAGNVEDLDRQPAPQEQTDPPSNSACHSGGDSKDCVGG